MGLQQRIRDVLNGFQSPKSEQKSHKGVGIFEPPYLYVFIGSILFAIVYALSAIFIIENNEIKAWLSRISVGLAGSYITAIVIDREFRNREAMERRQIQTTALEQLEPSLRSHIELLLNWYVASSVKLPPKLPNSYDEFFDEDYIKRIKWLDLSSESPVYTIDPSEDYIAYNGKSMSEFTEDINQIMSQYNTHLDSDMVQDLVNLSNSDLMGMLILLNDNRESIGKLQEEEGVPFRRNMLDIEELMRPDGTTRAIEKHLGLVISIIDRYSNYPLLEFDSIDEFEVWNEDRIPKAGSARVELPETPFLNRKIDRICSNIENTLEITNSSSDHVKIYSGIHI